MYGILKLQDKISGDPGLGWRERYRAHGTEEPPQGVEYDPISGAEVARSATCHARRDAEGRHQTAGPEAPRS